jgi:hypothetical protein
MQRRLGVSKASHNRLVYFPHVLSRACVCLSLARLLSSEALGGAPAVVSMARAARLEAVMASTAVLVLLAVVAGTGATTRAHRCPVRARAGWPFFDFFFAGGWGGGARGGAAGWAQTTSGNISPTKLATVQTALTGLSGNVNGMAETSNSGYYTYCTVTGGAYCANFWFRHSGASVFAYPVFSFPLVVCQRAGM